MRFSQVKTKDRRQPKKRIFAAVILICFIVAFVLSETFIMIHSAHEHDRGGIDGSCLVCCQIKIAENVLKNLSAFALISMFALTLPFILRAVYGGLFGFVSCQTPVTLKNQMNR